MRILLKLELDCTPDAAWNAIRSPNVFREVSFPFTTFSSLEEQGFPAQWPEGRHLLGVRGLGVVEIGRQCVDISYDERRDVRIMRDGGIGVSGLLSLVTRWRHSMAVSATPDGRTLYRDELVFSTGPATVLAWPVFWLFWQWRAFGMRRLAPRWR